MNRFIIDGMNLAHRSHNANFELKTADGRPSGMFFGFVRAVISLKKRYRSYRFSVVWDSKSERKLAIKPDYKADRLRLPQNVMDEIQDIRMFLTSCGVDQYDRIGEEADDVIATIVSGWHCQDGHIVVYSNDKDFLQLVEDGKVVVFRPKIGQIPEKFYDESAVIERFGVPPKLLASFRSFDGDPSDGLGGIPRVRRKVVAALISEHRDLDTLYASLGSASLSEKERTALELFKEAAYQNLEMMRLDESVPDVLETKGEVDRAMMSELLASYSVKSVDPEAVGDLFMSDLNLRYGDIVTTKKVETISLF